MTPPSSAKDDLLCYQCDTELDVLHVARKDKKTIVMYLALHDCMHDRERMQIY